MNCDHGIRRALHISTVCALSWLIASCSGTEVVLGQELPTAEGSAPSATNSQGAPAPGQAQTDVPGDPGFGMGDGRRFADGQVLDPTGTASLGAEPWGFGRDEQLLTDEFDGEPDPDRVDPDSTDLDSMDDGVLDPERDDDPRGQPEDGGVPFDSFGNTSQ